MKLLGIMGSPRMGGNTNILLDEALRGAREGGADVEKIVVDALDISPCRELYSCEIDGKCGISDDMDELYDKLLQADAVIVASPIFFYSVTAQLKALIDRCQALWVRRYILKQEPPDGGRRGAFIAVGATKGADLFDGSIKTVKYLFDSIGVRYTEDLLVRGVDRKGEVRQHPTALSDAYAMGRRLAK